MSGMREIEADSGLIAGKMSAYTARAERCLERALPSAKQPPARLHEAMRYAALSGGKRIRPLLVYATGECLGVEIAKLDAPATAIELIHAFSLVHDDLPAMDNDDLRRGQPTVHRKFDEATAILAADALQPLAFQVIASSAELRGDQVQKLVELIAEACGSLGMTGGQAIDLASEGKPLTVSELAEMHGLKTGALIRAAVMSSCCLSDDHDGQRRSAMDHFSRDIGLAFQIRDDILDVAGHTSVIGKPAGSDQALNKATWPGLFGMAESIRRCDELLKSALARLSIFADDAEPLRMLASYVVERSR
jgi:geranylgeranyl pyrophosphate synthase